MYPDLWKNRLRVDRAGGIYWDGKFLARIRKLNHNLYQAESFVSGQIGYLERGSRLEVIRKVLDSEARYRFYIRDSKQSR